MKLVSVALDWSWSEGSSVTITSGNAPTGVNALGEPLFTTAVSYNGPANIFDESGTVINDMLGVIASEVMGVIINGSPPFVNGAPTLPQGIAVGDSMKINGDPNNNNWLVQYVHYWDVYPYCIKMQCNLAKGG